MNQSSQPNAEARRLSVLVVDDDELVLKTLHSLLKSKGYDAIAVSNEKDALEAASKKQIDIAMLDLMLGEGNGIELMGRLREIVPSVMTIIVTGYGTIEKAVEAMHQGAWDFLTKPVTSGMLFEKLDRIEEICMLRREQDFRRKVIDRDFAYSGMIGPSPVMTPIYEAVLRAAQSSLPVLIEGETGSGKEYLAEAIHLNSTRSKKPYVIMDCTATPNSLIEATLFGSTKGAFTGAVERKGLLEAADGGSIFLDEVGEIEIDIQPKLLRCLETGRFRPVGSTKETGSDFRIICATNRDLMAETKAGSFRTDLFYRISAQRIVIPPLRERAADIPVLARFFLTRIANEYNRTDADFTPEALRVIAQYAWPGNIRQLRFVVESAFFQTVEGKIGAEHLSIENEPVSMTDSIQSAVDVDQDFKSFRDDAILQAETAYIKQLLESTNGDVRLAAQKAGLTREAMYRVMSRCNLSASEFRDS
ncbi:MAG: response regulator [bacterium]|nr:response regulator [bacterium]